MAQSDGAGALPSRSEILGGASPFVACMAALESVPPLGTGAPFSCAAIGRPCMGLLSGYLCLPEGILTTALGNERSAVALLASRKNSSCIDESSIEEQRLEHILDCSSGPFGSRVKYCLIACVQIYCNACNGRRAYLSSSTGVIS